MQVLQSVEKFCNQPVFHLIAYQPDALLLALRLWQDYT